MAIRVVSAGTTLVKKITVGTPTKVGAASVGTIAAQDDVNGVIGRADGTYLRFDSATSKFLNRGFAADVNVVVDANQASTSINSFGPISTTEMKVQMVSGQDQAATFIGPVQFHDADYIPSSDADLAGRRMTIEHQTLGVVDGYSGGIENRNAIVFTTPNDDSNSFIFQTKTFGIETDAGGAYLRTADSGQVSLFHLGTKKFCTTAAGVDVYGHVLPYSDSTYDLGSSTKKWKDLYLSGSTINLGTIKLKQDTGAGGGLTVEDSAGNKLTMDISANNTSQLSESPTALYYTTQRADSDAKRAIQGGSGIIYDSANGLITVDDSTANVNFNMLTLTDQLRGPASFVIDPAGIGDNTGKVIIRGNLQVDGVQTTINSTTVSVNDKNIILADSAADSAAAAGAGITVTGANASIIYNASTDTWDLNKPLGSLRNHLINFNTANLSEGTNLYYTTARADSDAKKAFSAGDGIDISIAGEISGEEATTSNRGVASFNPADFTVSSGAVTLANTGVDSGTYGSASKVPILTINAKGQIDSAGLLNVAGVSTFSFDSDDATLSIGTADGNTFNTRIGLSAFSTNNLVESSGNLYFTEARARASISAAGDLSYNAGTGVLSFDVENVYTQSNFDSDFNTSLDAAAVGGIGLAYNSTTNTLRIDSAELAANFSTANITEGSNLYHTTARARSAVTVTDAGGDGSLAYNSGTGVITYTGPSAAEVRAHFSVADGVVLTSGAISLGNITPDTVSTASITNTSGTINTVPTQASASSDSVIIVDNTAHDSDFMSVEYTVHMDDSIQQHSQISKLLLTYNKTNVFFTEYGVISSFTNDSDIGTLTADVLGANVRLKFQRAAGMGTVNVKPTKTIIK